MEIHNFLQLNLKTRINNERTSDKSKTKENKLDFKDVTIEEEQITSPQKRDLLKKLSKI
jgi:hypothetical protein